MKRTWMGFIIFLCGAIVICTASVSYARHYNYGSFHFIGGFGMVSLKNTEEFAADGIENIDISYSSENIIFLKGEADKIVIKEYLHDGGEDHTRMEVEGNTLYIKKNERVNGIYFLSFLGGSERIEIYLPEAFGGSVNATASSGNITSDPAWSFKEFYANVKSGNITCKEIEAEKITAETSSGNISFGKAQGERTLTASSGNIVVSSGAGDTYASASSGNITVEGASGNFKASTHSGNIKAELISLGETVEAEVSSGNIRLDIPKNSAFSFEAEASSGIIDTDFDEYLSYSKKGNKANGTYGENVITSIRTRASSGNTEVKFR